MANNTVYIDVVVDDKGTTKKVALDSARLRQTLDQAADANDRYSRTQRTAYRNAQGVAQNTANGTKAFAKQAQGIGGILVPAYATLAANIFATTAAFGALNKAAQVEQLEASLIRVGNIAGRNLRVLSDSLKEISGDALSTAQALEVVATGTAQNFSSSQLQELTTIAKGASIALGRDMSDSIDRLVRGTAKLEPEILDELGIIVRLDEATRVYAASLGKTEAQLTQFEKQQAFANAVTEQGIKKFGDVAANADPTPYQKLAATFNDLSTSIVGLLAGALEPLISILASNPVALAGALALFAGTIGKQLTPALSSLAQESKEIANEASSAAKEALEATQSQYANLKNSIISEDIEIIPSGATKVLIDSLKDGTENAEKFEKGLAGVSKSIGQRTAGLTKLEDELKKKREAAKKSGVKLSAEEIKTLEEKIELRKAEIEQVEQLQEELNQLNDLRLQEGGTGGVAEGSQERAAQASRVSEIANREAEALKDMEEAAKKGLSGLKASFKAAGKATLGYIQDIGKTPGVMGKFTAALTAGRAGIRLFGLAIINAIPIVGQIIAVLSIAYEVLDAFITFPWEKNEIDKATDEIVDNLKGVSDAAIQMEIEVIKATSGTEKAIIKLKNSTGVIDQLASSFDDLVKATRKPIFENIKESTEDYLDVADGGLLDNFWTSVKTTVKGLMDFKSVGLEDWEAERKRELTNAKNAIIGYSSELKNATISQDDFRKVAIAGKMQAIAYGFSETSAVVKRYDEALALAEKRGSRGLQIKDLTKLSRDLRELNEISQRFTSSLNEMAAAFSDFNTALNKFLDREIKTPFDGLADASGRITGIFKNFNEGLDEAIVEARSLGETFDVELAIDKEGALKGFQDLKESPRFKEIFSIVLDEQLSQAIPDTNTRSIIRMTGPENVAKLPEGALGLGISKENAQATADAVARAYATAAEAASAEQEKMLLGAQNAYRGFDAAIKTSKERAAELGKLSSNNVAIFEEQRREQANLKDIEIDRNDAVLMFLSTLADVSGKQELVNKLTQDNIRLQTERQNILNDQVALEEKRLAEVKYLEGLQNKLLDAKQQEFELSQKLLEIEQKRSLREAKQIPFFDFVDQGEMEIDLKIEAEQKKLLQLQSDTQKKIDESKIAVIKAEYALLDAQIRAQAAQAESLGTDEGKASAAALNQILSDGVISEALRIAEENVRTGAKVRIEEVTETIEALKQAKTELSDINQITNTLESAFTNNLTSAIDGVIQGTMKMEDAFKNMAVGVLKALSQVLAKLIAIKIIEAGMSLFMGGGAASAADTSASGTFGSMGIPEAGALGVARYGGVFSNGSKMPGYAVGGIAKGPDAGYPAMLHGTEAVVPLPNNRSIPVDLKGSGQQNNVTVNVSVDNNGNAQQDTQATGQQSQRLGQAIAAAVQKELHNQKRSGGILNPYGVA